MRSTRMQLMVAFFVRRKEMKNTIGQFWAKPLTTLLFFPPSNVLSAIFSQTKGTIRTSKENGIKIISRHRHSQSCFFFFFLPCVSLPSFSLASRSALPWHQNKNPLHGFLPESCSIPAMCSPDIVKTSFVRVQNISLTCLLPKSGTFG